MKFKMLTVVVAGVSMSLGVSSMAQCCGVSAGAASDSSKKEASTCKPQTLCPVMGGKVDKAIFTDIDGCRVYFCCGECVETFKKDPAKYLKVIKDNGETPEKVPASCPLKKSE